ncbi:hypothetical protein [Cohnella sp. AR92]|uniref:hypothetical protein n=1 Tax=Cohnella sp. AR92 TaxID=648716 RepID=UPI000F8E6A52|nr:hypothetical protein [Cohnella sp. AR92]RUS48145.1 hypothetical protein ELR57_06330 [Cohnella sp. AR92]
MKTTTFLMGAMAGAALVLFARRNRMVSAAAGMVGQQMRNRWSGMKEDAVGKMVNMRFGGRDHNRDQGKDHGGSIRGDAHSGSRRSENRTSGASVQSSDHTANGMSDVVRLASDDPSVKHAINEILEQSGEHRI